MLCTKIILLDTDADVLDGFSDLPPDSCDMVNIHYTEGYLEIDKSADDGRLYKVCSDISEIIYKTLIKNDIKTFLFRTYDCFTADEYGRILKLVWERPFSAELPGRLYVYLKVNNKVNPVGFYRFMCRDLSVAAKDAAIEEADRIIDMNERNEMIETLRCFAGMSAHSVNKVVLCATCDKIDIKECIPAIDVGNAEFSRENTDVLAELVSLNPKIIEVHGREDFRKNDISTVIEAVFEDRIQYK